MNIDLLSILIIVGCAIALCIASLMVNQKHHHISSAMSFFALIISSGLLLPFFAFSLSTFGQGGRLPEEMFSGLVQFDKFSAELVFSWKIVLLGGASFFWAFVCFLNSTGYLEKILAKFDFPNP